MNEIANLFTQNGADAYYGEPVTQLAHALQCAQLAEEAGADAETIAAAFLHDIGHMLPVPDDTAYMDDYGTVDHEGLGAHFLRQQGFPEKVAQLVEHHVNAKRYLVFKNDDYRARLSEASQQTLLFQGGPMTADEAATFEQHPYFKPIIQLRLWDERAKLVDHITPDADHYLAIAAQVRSAR